MMTHVALAAASDSTPNDTPFESLDLVQPYDFTERWNAGWSLTVDNDAFATNDVDRDAIAEVTKTIMSLRNCNAHRTVFTGSANSRKSASCQMKGNAAAL